MRDSILIFIGGGAGSLLRYTIGLLVPSFGLFPLSTFISNFFASLLLGIIATISSKVGDVTWIKPLFLIGVCGGFSTFSTFAGEGFKLFSESYLMMAVYLSLSVFCCVIAYGLGVQLIKVLY